MSERWEGAPEERLRHMFAMGMSSGLIANQLSKDFTFTYTRNAIIGKLNRLGLSVKVRGPSTTAVEKPARITRPKPRARRIGGFNKATVIPFVRAATPELEPSIDDSGAPRNDLIDFFDLKPTSCRWPYGDNPFLFCGLTVCDGDPKNPYCSHHASIAFVKPQPRVGARPFRRAA